MTTALVKIWEHNGETVSISGWFIFCALILAFGIAERISKK